MLKGKERAVYYEPARSTLTSNLNLDYAIDLCYIRERERESLHSYLKSEMVPQTVSFTGEHPISVIFRTS